MKKILCLLVLLLSLTATCAAFNPPQPPRWYWIGSDAHYGAWIDTATARFYTGSEKYAHSNHQCALVWVEWYNADEDTYVISHDEYDLDCRMKRTLYATFYNSQIESLIHITEAMMILRILFPAVMEKWYMMQWFC